MKLSKRYDAVLFDFDGVLADSEPLHWRCWREILAPFAIDLTWEAFVRDCIGVSDRDLIQRVAAQRDPPIPFEDLWAEYPRKKELFRDRIAAQPPFLPETVRLVAELSSGYKLAVVSSSARSEIEPALIAAGVRPCFIALVCGKEALNLKPAPDPYLMAAELLESERPLVVEDSAAGVASAVAAGFDVVQVRDVREVAGRVAEALGLLREERR